MILKAPGYPKAYASLILYVILKKLELSTRAGGPASPAQDPGLASEVHATGVCSAMILKAPGYPKTYACLSYTYN